MSYFNHDTVHVDLKCLVLSGSDGTKAYGLVKTRNVHILVQALIPAGDPQSVHWEFVTAGWSFQELYDLQGDSASCIMNKAGELIAMGPWTGIQTSNDRDQRGLVYNSFNPLPVLEGKLTSNASWMRVILATTTDKYQSEWAQLMIDTGSDINSEREIALTKSQIVFRYLNVFDNRRELVNMGAWTLPRPLNDSSTAQLQYSNNSLYVFSAHEANDTSLMKIPFNPSSSIPNQLRPELPTGTATIDISSTANKCAWDIGFTTAVSDNKFYLLCQKIEMGTIVRSLFVYENTPDNKDPALGAAVPVNGIDPSCTVRMFQPVGNKTFAMLNCEMSNNYPQLVLLPLSGPYAGNATRMSTDTIQVSHDTLFNNLLPSQGEISGRTDNGIPREEGIIGAVFGTLALVAIAILTLRHKRQERSKAALRKDAEAMPGSYGLEPLGASGVTGLSSHPSSAVGLVQSTEANTHLSPAVYAAPQVANALSPDMSAGLSVSSWRASPPTAASSAPLSSTTLSPAPSEGSPSVPTSGSPPANTYQMELQQLGFSSHPRPNFVTTVND
ncbi:unnamed protein product [Mortierella alpina]